MFSGDNIRDIFNLKGYEYKERLVILKKYTKFAKYITDQKLNLILAVVGLADAPRKWNRKNIDNYMEIYIKCNIRKIMNLKKKKIYHNKKSGKIIGINIKPQIPKKPDITIINSFNETSDKIAKKLLKKINNLIKIKT
jgi:adenylylsulfate kinase-like enzyme